jgi:hypothetical protein
VIVNVIGFLIEAVLRQALSAAICTFDSFPYLRNQEFHS